MNWKIELRSSNIRNLLESAMPHIVNQLNLNRNKCSVMVICDRDLTHSGLTIPNILDNEHLIVLRPSRNPAFVFSSLCHEMVHIAQTATGRLKGWRWCGKKWPKNTPYMNRPWELDAYSKQEILLRRTLDKLEKL